MSVPTENLTLCEPELIDLWLDRRAVRIDVFHALVALGDDILDMLPIVYRDRPDSVAWGYCIASIVGNTRQLGIYGDYTCAEHDAIVLPALAPFMQDGSRYIFREKDEWKYGYDEFEGWSFNGLTATKLEVERIVEFEWVRP